MMRVLSDVFPSEIKPVRDGWYLVECGSQFGEIWTLIRWSGTEWMNPDECSPFTQNRRWMALAFDPAGAFLTWQDTDEMAGRRLCERGVFVPGARSV